MNAKVDPAVIAASRAAFEDEVFKAHFIKSISKKKPSDQFMSCDALNKDELCERDGDDYKRPEVSAMWFGWRLHEEAEFKLKYPGLNELGVRGLVVESGIDVPTSPSQEDALRELQHAEPVAVTERWLSGARWAHRRWLKALRLER